MTSSLANVNDVAAYILKAMGPVSAWKLQKLVYYCQAWSLVWDERPIFKEEIQAWANGPVCPVLYEEHRGQFLVEKINGDPSKLDSDALGTVVAILDSYGGKTPQWLRDLTHMEAPWRVARGDTPDGVRSTNPISLGSMAEYYGSL